LIVACPSVLGADAGALGWFFKKQGPMGTFLMLYAIQINNRYSYRIKMSYFLRFCLPGKGVCPQKAMVQSFLYFKKRSRLSGQSPSPLLFNLPLHLRPRLIDQVLFWPVEAIGLLA
jgi:hypothetical protein